MAWIYIFLCATWKSKVHVVQGQTYDCTRKWSWNKESKIISFIGLER